MIYDTDADPYLDPHTGVLRNLLGIEEGSALQLAEASLVTARIARLVTKPIPGNFDLDHLQSLHRHLFSGIYGWAGELRTVEMVKGETRFAGSAVLPQAAVTVFAELRQERLLQGLTDRVFAIRLAHFYSEINILHPFREGNGRTQRVFLTLLAAHSGRRLAWEQVTPEQHIEACIRAYQGDERLLAQLMTGLVTTEQLRELRHDRRDLELER